MDGFGVVDHNDTRDLLAAAARDPRTRWCVTTLHPDGTASAHACVPGRHPPPGFATTPPRPLPRARSAPGPAPWTGYASGGPR